MASLDMAFKYQTSLLSSAYDAAIQRYTEALLAGMDDTKAQHELDAACEKADNYYTEALTNITEEFFNSQNDMILDTTVVVEARVVNENEQTNNEFIVVAEVVE